MSLLVAVLAAGATLLSLWRPPLPVPGAAVGAAADGALLLRTRPLLALVAGVGTAVFLGGPVGVAAGVLATGFAWRAVGRLATVEDRRRAAVLERDLPGAVDLLVAGFRAGLAPEPALGLVAEAMPGPVGDELGLLRRRLEIGTDPAQVWRELSFHPQLGALGRALGRAHARGAAVVPAGERLAAELRERSEATVEARARSVSTRAAAPLGVCFLPAFVLLGIVPLVAGLLGSLHLFG